MVNFKTEWVNEHITRIYAINTELMYLVEGEKQAALIDTGSGFGSLKKVVRLLTDKPLIVLLTHGHTDHAMGAAEFDHVYMNHVDDYIYGPHGEEAFRKDGMKMSKDYSDLEPSDYIPTAPVESFFNMKGGDSFDLGGLHIDIYDCPGHTHGSVVMLVREERTLLLGDACNQFTFVYDDYSLTITEYKKNLTTLKEQTKGTYDQVLASHGDGKLPVDIIEQVIQVCEDIQSGNVDAVPFEFRGGKGLIAKRMNEQMQRVDGKQGNVVYRPDRI